MNIMSADSHVHEPQAVWLQVPKEFQERAAQLEFRAGSDSKPGGSDPTKRVEEMEVDGVSAEVLYPTTGLKLFSLDDPQYQEALFRAYNDWLASYCQVAPERLVGIPLISLFNVNNAVKELERCRGMGMEGALIWLVPHPDLPFTSDHYEPFWDAAQALEAPISLPSPLHP